MMRSESTNALGHPRLVKEIRGAFSMYRLEPVAELFGIAFQLIDPKTKFNRFGCSGGGKMRHGWRQPRQAVCLDVACC
ncbi:MULTISPECIES: hypothetical protein [Bradyrhizobium]|uniref:hypothetical protein n=1 Tax=Bradyrhizobium TaxID=374 RepID=UPI001BA6CFE3|nr:MULTISPECIES: hypothetical protein [Bradyrhizobium]WLC03322.1 hypothetical protein QIH92_24845 [Bradyrhizobium japonicum USDA 123]MCP1741629.1 hypothetical protein [Bradyrhizobium japonicum]MCP1779587.1 hypothetical protein [Bradyrhizobium japonicum]MCP1859298.1 hypothetical protein [Bradyrhizobium japonicum]MCP1890113.1 hypothetical protein [Bradyrhizobium japonicum]